MNYRLVLYKILGLAILKVLLLVILICCGLVSAVENGEPQIAFVADSIDIGQMRPGDKVYGEFTVLNKGNADLVISRVAPT